MNGQPVDRDRFRLISSYVPQQDYGLPRATVYEEVAFAARMKFPDGYMRDRAAEDAQRTQDVDVLLHTVGLAKERDSFVGNKVVRGLSGGQRRRLALCKGLITSPVVVYMDEPTSGLSSSDSELVIQACRLIATHLSVTFVVVIHQPRHSLFKLFDHLMLLCEGRTVYNGANLGLDRYFGSLGFAAPAGENPADYLLDIITPGVEGSQLEMLADRWECTQSHKVLAEVADSFANRKRFLPIREQIEQSLRALPRQTKQVHTSLFKQFRLLQGREVRMLTRHWDETLVGVLNAAVLGFLIGSIFLNTRKRVDPVTGLATDTIQCQLAFVFTVAITASMLCFGNLPILTNEQVVFLNKRAKGLYTTVPYMLSKFSTRIALSVIQILVITLIAYFMAGFKGGLYMFFLLAVFSAWFALDATLAAISVVTPTHEVASVLAGTVLTVCSLFNGFTSNSHSSPGWIIWIQYLSPSYYSFLAPCIELFSDYKGFPWDCSVTQSTTALQQYCDTVGTGLSQQFGMSSSMMWPSIGILWTSGVLFWTVAVVWQHARVKLQK